MPAWLCERDLGFLTAQLVEEKTGRHPREARRPRDS